MAVELKQMIAGTALTATLATLYTAPVNKTVRANEMLLCNTDTAARKVTVHFIASGGSAGVLNTILDEIVLGPGETRTLGLDQVLIAGDFVQAKADAADVVAIRMSGVEVS